MNILIIGGAGYIGSHVTRYLLDKGHNLTVFDNLSTGLRKNLQKEASFIKGDILDEVALRKAMGNSFDAVIYLAALKSAGESMDKPEEYARNNISGSINILNAMSKEGIKKIIFSSTSAVYGDPSYLPLDEKHSLEPVNFYGFTKLEIERLLEWYNKLRGIRFVSLRYFNAAGYDPQGRITGLEQNPTNLIPIVMEVAAGIREKVFVFGNDYNTADGTGVRDYVHVSDLSEGHYSALNYLLENDNSLTVNLGAERGHSVLEVIHTAEKICGKEIPFQIVDRRAGDPDTVYTTALLAKKTLGWDPKHSSLKTLLESHWMAYQANYPDS